MALTFYNSLTRSQVPFDPIEPRKARLYTCGPTVYNFAHIGNFRAYVFEDLLRRTLRYCGHDVEQVMNLTDVDDKTIRDSGAAGVSLREFTAPFKKAFFEDLDTLNVERAEHYPAATDHIEDMIRLVQTLVEKGYAYVAEDKSVYFSIERFPDYGKLARIDLSRMRSGERVKNDEYAKESVADFALWKAWDEQDGDVYWDSPWGPGRPGWHIECSAMSMRYLGKTFDIHTGGVDNMFPHHEDEIAQSEAANGCRFVNYWLHCAHLIVDGKKMSKSLGNFYTLRDLVERGYGGREIRWVLMGAHYRQHLNFTFQGLEDARAALQRIDDFVLRLREAADAEDAAVEEAETRCKQAQLEFRAGLEDDLNVSAALAALFDLVRDGNKMLRENRLGGAGANAFLNVLRDLDQVCGCLEIDRKGAEVPADVVALAHERQKARGNKDFAAADRIRDELADRGWVVEDTAAGPRIKRRD